MNTSRTAPVLSPLMALALLLQFGYWFRAAATPLALAYDRFTAVWLIAEGFSAFAVFVDFVVRFDHIPPKLKALKTILVGLICCGFLFHLLAAYLDAMQ
jgi:hypothetical protein